MEIRWLSATRAAAVALLASAAWTVVATSQDAPQPTARGRSQTAAPLVPLEESWLRWPLPPPEQAYGQIDGQRLKSYVKEITAISRRSRDRGEQWWGRIQGMAADAETQQWLAEKFRHAGVQDVRIQSLDLPPQWYPTSWAVSASDKGSTVRLESVMPGMRSP